MHSRCIDGGGGAAIGDLGTQKWHRCRRWMRGPLAHRSFNDNGESNGETVTGAPSQGGAKAIKTNIATQLALTRKIAWPGSGWS